MPPTEAGIVRPCKSSHQRKHAFGISVRPYGSVTEVRLEQQLKVLSPMPVTLSGSLMLLSAKQKENPLTPIVFRPSGKVIEVRWVKLEKA